MSGQVLLKPALQSSVIHTSGPLSPSPGNVVLRKENVSVITASLSPDVITTPSGIPQQMSEEMPPRENVGLLRS